MRYFMLNKSTLHKDMLSIAFFSFVSGKYTMVDNKHKHNEPQ